jgi:pimeloyl-ACP methyl ester carboxylesterase
MKVIVDDLLINYEDQGKGKTILAIHGWTNDAGKSFDQLSVNLSKSYRLIIPDLPGFGQSSPPAKSWGVPEYGAFIQKFINKIGIKPDYVLAHSNGGTIGLYALSQGMIKPRKVVFLSSAGVRQKNALKKALLSVAAKPIKAVLIPLPSNAQKRIKKSLYGKIGSDLYVLENMQPIFKKIVEYDIQNAAQNVIQPTLLIYGVNDRSTPIAHGKLLASHIPHSQLVFIENAGHFVYIDQPEQTLKLLKDFLI